MTTSDHQEPPSQKISESRRALFKRWPWIDLKASDVTAIFSFIVAFVSLAYTIVTQRDEQWHREASIRPALGLEFSDSFTFVAVNYGTGPAVIENSVVGYEDRCVDSVIANARPDSWDIAIKSAGSKIAEELFREVAVELPNVDESYRESAKRVTFLPNGAIVPPTNRYNILWLGSVQTAAQVQFKRTQNFMPVWISLMERFPPRGFRFYYRVKYSSITGKYTAVSETSRGGMRCP